MSTPVRIVAGVVALGLEAVVIDAALRTFLLPRVAKVRLSVLLATTVRLLFRPLSGPGREYATRDRVLALYPSIVLLTYQAMWLALSVVAFAFGFVAAGAPGWARAFEISGSSLFTLGTSSGTGPAQVALGYAEAAVGLTLLALLIAFIPTLYGAFQRRELSVSRLAVRAGVPATPWGILEIAQSVASYDRLEELWREWEQWFTEVGETHTTLVILNFYRSPSAEQTWIGCAASVLDAAAIYNAAVDVEPSASAGLCIRSGWITLRKLADYFGVAYPVKPDRTLPIAISREEFDVVLARLERGGIPILADREAAWCDFLGWRVNYDAMIEAFYPLFTCPRVDWRSAEAQPLVAPSNRRGG
ncbi:MAG: hypothetical protein KGJ36_06235 [Acidobacteriota bacterium]|nr:hypothetical protein [Acidobacteriota bacterium]